MKKISYFDERDIKTRAKIEEVKNKLPSFCSEYAISILSAGCSSLTAYNYLVDLTVFFEYLADSFNKQPSEIEIKDLETLKAKDISSFLDYQRLGRGREMNGKMVESKSGIKAIARKLSSIKSLFRYLFNNEMIASNVTTRIPTPKISMEDHSIKRLNKEETKVFLDAPNNKTAFGQQHNHYLENTAERDKAIISLFLATGIRVSELVGLDVLDVNLASLTIDVRRKGGKLERLYFAEDLAKVLEIWVAKRESLNLPKNETAFFISLQRKRMSVSSVEKMIGKYAEVLLGKKLSPHKLRATYGTELYKATGDIYQVATALGHSSVDTTKKHYADTDEQKKREIAGKVRIG